MSLACRRWDMAAAHSSAHGNGRSEIPSPQLPPSQRHPRRGIFSLASEEPELSMMVDRPSDRGTKVPEPSDVSLLQTVFEDGPFEQTRPAESFFSRSRGHCGSPFFPLLHSRNNDDDDDYNDDDDDDDECNDDNYNGDDYASPQPPPMNDCKGDVADCCEDDDASFSSFGSESSLSGGSLRDDSLRYSGETEAESSYTGPLDSLSSLGASLPVKKGLSRFYTGKSRSFSCLADIGSIKEVAKMENPYAKRRKSFTSLNGMADKARFYAPRSSAAGISKKPINGNRSTLALAVAMSTATSSDADTSSKWQSHSAPPRSLSLSDLQTAAILPSQSWKNLDSHYYMPE